MQNDVAALSLLVAWAACVCPCQICLEPYLLILEVPHVVEVEVYLLLRHDAVEVHGMTDVGHEGISLMALLGLKGMY